MNSHQIFSFKYLIAHLKTGGIYVIEDVQTSYWSEFGGEPVHKQNLSTCVGYFTELAKYLNFPEFRNSDGVDAELTALAKMVESILFQHNLIIIHKRVVDAAKEVPTVAAR
jgi:demethylmacrocin O-methyltransferase